MRRRGSSSIAANPVLIGAATVLVIVVAVFLAYNANSGLPFVPTYALKVEVPNAANLVVGNEVRVGGARVGVVESIDPVNHPNGSVTARLGMKLETTIKPLPKDSTILIRSKSALGLKYVEITKGTSSAGYPDGGTIPITASTPKQVEFDEVLSTFDERTRQASRSNLNEFGAAFAGRGKDLNQALQDLNPALRNLVPVMRNLSLPETQLARLFRALGNTAGQVAPVAETQASLFANLDTTFTALAKVARPQIQDSITGGVPAQDAAIKGLPLQRPFLLNTQRFFAELRPGVRSLRTAAPILTSALVVGTGTLQRSVALNRRLKPTFQALQRFATDPLVALGVKDLSNTASILNPTIAFLKPTQTVCNYATLWFRNVSSLLSVGDNNGTGQRFIIIATPQGPNNEGGPSSAPANGPNADNYLHANNYPNTAAPGQTQECEAANEPYAAGRQVIGNVPGNQGTSTAKTTIDRSR
ncbi:MAG: Mammalian cell entry related domain protein [Solirubrobacterales bacterium]|nr:Mammalian cell entry related domain protein [Solirubrobacterales bacterium]